MAATVLQLAALVLLVVGATVSFGLGGLFMGLGVAGFIIGAAMDGGGE
jgi:hypothetical protein